MSQLYDPNSCANLNEYRTTHLHLELEIDFEKSILTGHAQLTLKKLIDEEKPVELDCSSLNIVSITCEHSYLSVGRESVSAGIIIPLSLPCSTLMAGERPCLATSFPLTQVF